MRSHTCPRCQGSMTEGFVVDHTEGGARKVSTWVEGAPEPGLLVGVKVRGKTTYDIRTWRCGRCGFLESYAN